MLKNTYALKYIISTFVFWKKLRKFENVSLHRIYLFQNHAYTFWKHRSVFCCEKQNYIFSLRIFIETFNDVSEKYIESLQNMNFKW